MKRLARQLPFLHSILNASQLLQRRRLLQHANSDQINAISEIVLNLLRNRIPLQTMARLRRYKKVLREVGKRLNFLKRRREQLMNQRGAGYWLGLRIRVSLSFTIMEEMIIVPKKEQPEVVQWYKGEYDRQCSFRTCWTFVHVKETPLRRSHLGYR